MPIVFEQPEPFSAANAAAAGAYPIDQRRREMALEAMRQMGQGASLGLEANAQQAQARGAGGALLQRQQQFEESSREDQLAQQRQLAFHANLAAFQAEQQQRQMVLHANLDAWNNSRQLTDAEQIRHSRLEA